MSEVHFKDTRFGFEWGSMEIERLCDDEKQGYVILQIKTPKKEVQVYSTKTGKLRVHSGEGEWFLKKDNNKKGGKR